MNKQFIKEKCEGIKMETLTLKTALGGGLGILGGLISQAFGGWDAALTTLVVFMCIDYVSGFVVAGVFHKSNKTSNGKLESGAGWKGLCKKGMTFLIVFISYRLDMLIGSTFIQDAVIIAYVANELISIVENAGLMGIPIPAPILNAIDVLNKKGDNDENNQKSTDKE